MKVVMEFNIPEDNNDYILCNNARKYFSCLWDIDQKMRTYLKHGHKYASVEDLMEEIRSDICSYVDLYEVQ